VKRESTFAVIAVGSQLKVHWKDWMSKSPKLRGTNFHSLSTAERDERMRAARLGGDNVAAGV